MQAISIPEDMKLKRTITLHVESNKDTCSLLEFQILFSSSESQVSKDLSEFLHSFKNMKC